jgi:hypothetical protein
MVFDAFGWLTLGVSLVAFSRILRKSCPIVATFIFIAGAGHLFGFLGGLLRMTGVHDLGIEYAAATDPSVRAAVRSSYLALYQVIGGLFTAGDIMAAAGWLLVGWGLRTSKVLPQWVAGFALLSGVVVTVFTPFSIIDPVSAFPVLLLYIIGGVIVFHLLFAFKFWRSGSAEPQAN